MAGDRKSAEAEIFAEGFRCVCFAAETASLGRLAKASLRRRLVLFGQAGFSGSGVCTDGAESSVATTKNRLTRSEGCGRQLFEPVARQCPAMRHGVTYGTRLGIGVAQFIRDVSRHPVSEVTAGLVNWPGAGLGSAGVSGRCAVPRSLRVLMQAREAEFWGVSRSGEQGG
jgi:hypothetical protein